MLVPMKWLFSKPSLRSLSALFVNLSAGWFGAAFIAPNIVELARVGAPVVLLTKYLSSGILCLLVSIKIEEELAS